MALVIDFFKINKFAIFTSILLILLSIFFVSTKSLNFGVDFSGGLLLEMQSANKIDNMALKTISQNLEELGIQGVLQSSGVKSLVVKLKVDEKNRETTLAEVKKLITNVVPDTELQRVDFIGPQVSQEFFLKSELGIAGALLGILVYLLIRFDVRFALGGVIALVHDVILMFGFFALTRLEFNMIAVSAILTIIGYSINDSVIIFDRIREVSKDDKVTTSRKLVTLAINKTMGRTVLTSFTTLLAAVSLAIFGGRALEPFSLSMIFGIIIGTYSSIFIAPQLLVYKGKEFWDRGTLIES